MEHIAITGGAGMIGSNLLKRLVKNGCRVTVADNLWRGKKENLCDEQGIPCIDMAHDFHVLDLSVPGACDDLLKGVDYVYHLADAVSGIGYAFKNQGWIFRQNMLINSNVMEAVRRNPVKGFIYVGTACSFPHHKQTGVTAAPLVEEDQYPAAPESAYGWSKLMGEYEALLMERESGMPVSVLVLHNVYGSPCDYSSERSQVIPALIRKAILYPKEPFVVWGNGEQGRAFVHIDDVVEALISAKDKGLGKGAIQIGPDECTEIKDIVKMIVDISGKTIEAEYDASRPVGDKGRCANYRKARTLLDWKPKVPLREGLESLYNWIEQDLKKASCNPGIM